MRSNQSSRQLPVHHLGKPSSQSHWPVLWALHSCGQLPWIEALPLFLWEHPRANPFKGFHKHPKNDLAFRRLHESVLIFDLGVVVKEETHEEAHRTPPFYSTSSFLSPLPISSFSKPSRAMTHPSHVICSSHSLKWHQLTPRPWEASTCLKWGYQSVFLWKRSCVCCWKNTNLSLWWYNHENCSKMEQAVPSNREVDFSRPNTRRII